MKRLTLVVVILVSFSVLAAAQSCLVVRQAEGHRFSGVKYEYVDAYNVPNPKMQYKGEELQKLQANGTHLINVQKAKKGISTAEEVRDARESCKSMAATLPPQPTTTPQRSTVVSNLANIFLQPPQRQEEPLGDVARRYQQKQQQTGGGTVAQHH